MPLLCVPPEVTEGRLPNGHSYIDLLAPLRLLLAPDTDAKEHESKLFAQVVPVLEEVLLDPHPAGPT